MQKREKSAKNGKEKGRKEKHSSSLPMLHVPMLMHPKDLLGRHDAVL